VALSDRYASLIASHVVQTPADWLLARYWPKGSARMMDKINENVR
jgi:hypothetical protein